ncbi:hypothetical protein NQ315_002103 [Exocentrus adspersus]|uniref:Oleoyl-[acyl-carrier-protein] hydrolase n=1 Tax=Exocentrus adspersus TaxID=1586481 RepID=A0AAV8VZR3_9CUCU|nr:hypothetical protein NQ315_002103 [Exocentrus adspersus]
MLKNKKYAHLKDLLLQNLLKNPTTQKSEKDATRVDNIINRIVFNRVSNTELIGANSVLLQIGYSPREETEDVTAISLFSCKSKSYLLDFLKGLGSLYEIGDNPQISKLYPDINLPVSRGTQMISPYKWRHSRSKTIPKYNWEVAEHVTLGDRTFAIQVNNTDWKFITGHIVDVHSGDVGNEKGLCLPEHHEMEMAQSVLPTVLKYTTNKEYLIVSYSYGTLVALEVVSTLEARGYAGTLITIDGAPMLMKEMLLNLEVESPRIFETALVCHLLSLFMSFEEIAKQKEKLFMCPTWEDRMNLGTEIVRDHTIHEANYQKLVANSIYKRTQALMIYTPSYSKLKTKVKLIKPTQSSVTGLPEDYGLSQYFEKPIQVQNFEGNHFTIIENEAVVEFINTCVQEWQIGSNQQ